MEDRYAGWSAVFGQDVLGGGMGLDQVAARVLERNQDTLPVSGRQELLENLLNSYL
ncbi:Xylose isomerase [compost metagenome]